MLARQPWGASASLEDRRWLAAASDEVHMGVGAVIARQARPARWSYLVVGGEVEVGGAPVGPGGLVTPVDGDVVTTTSAAVLAIRARDEAELRRRFPGLGRAPVPARTPAPRCPIAALARSRRRAPVPASHAVA